MEDIIGIQKVDNGIGNAGIGWIVLDGDREDYITNCFHSNTISLRLGLMMGTYHNVPISPSDLQKIKFPEEDERTNPIVWIRNDNNGNPIVVSVLSTSPTSIGENQSSIKKDNVEIFLDGDTNTINISANGDAVNPSEFKINITSQDSDSVFSIYTDAPLHIASSNSINLTTKNINHILSNNGNILSEINIDRDIKFHNDKTDINTRDGNVNIDGSTVNINGGSESMILGDTLKGLLQDLISAINSITVTIPPGTIVTVGTAATQTCTIPVTTLTPNNAAQISAITARLQSMLSVKSKVS